MFLCKIRKCENSPYGHGHLQGSLPTWSGPPPQGHVGFHRPRGAGKTPGETRAVLGCWRGLEGPGVTFREGFGCFCFFSLFLTLLFKGLTFRLAKENYGNESAVRQVQAETAPALAEELGGPCLPPLAPSRLRRRWPRLFHPSMTFFFFFFLPLYLKYL